MAYVLRVQNILLQRININSIFKYIYTNSTLMLIEILLELSPIY